MPPSCCWNRSLTNLAFHSLSVSGGSLTNLPFHSPSQAMAAHQGVNVTMGFCLSSHLLPISSPFLRSIQPISKRRRPHLQNTPCLCPSLHQIFQLPGHTLIGRSDLVTLLLKMPEWLPFSLRLKLSSFLWGPFDNWPVPPRPSLIAPVPPTCPLCPACSAPASRPLSRGHLLPRSSLILMFKRAKSAPPLPALLTFPDLRFCTARNNHLCTKYLSCLFSAA